MSPISRCLRRLTVAGSSHARRWKKQLFTVIYGALKTARIIRECPLCLECRVVKTVEFQTNEFFIGEIVGSYTEDRYKTNGKPDIRENTPPLFTMPDNRYWTAGDYVGMPGILGEI
jgi:flavin reductase (DIM6/NTAB) family NADH-FMN oxidoreductase RutF